MGNTKNSNNNNFKGPVIFKGPAQVAGGDIINVINEEEKPRLKTARYTPEPVWRSPFTLAVLSWVSVILGLISVIPVANIFQNAINIFNGNIQEVMNFSIQFYTYFMVFSLLLLISVLSLRRIAKKQIRVPLVFDYAISGVERRIVLEKVKIGECPICGGKMKYYNKPIEWREYYVDGKRKREVIKRVPALECRRNNEHWFEVDPAEEKIS